MMRVLSLKKKPLYALKTNNHDIIICTITLTCWLFSLLLALLSLQCCIWKKEENK